MLVLSACSEAPTPRATSEAPTPRATSSDPTTNTNPNGRSPSAGHVVVVVLENRSYSDIIGNPAAPYLNTLARQGTSYTQMHALGHPSQPNYLALFSGSTHGVTDDSCPLHLSGPTLGGELRRAGLSFVGYSEDLPAAGSAACTAGPYVRKHAPWTNFAALPASTNQPFTAFPATFTALPTVSFVVPNLDNDMHDGSVARADTWVRQHLSAYATWARTHRSLLVVTWDEDDRSEDNRIPTIVVGAAVPAQQVSAQVTLYSLLRAIEDRYALPRLGAAASAPSLDLP